MILEILFNFIFTAVEGFLTYIPALPTIPDSIRTGVFNFIDLIFDNVGLLGVFVPINTLKTIIQLVLVIEVVEIAYFVVIWVLKKIPFINIS